MREAADGDASPVQGRADKKPPVGKHETVPCREDRNKYEFFGPAAMCAAGRFSYAARYGSCFCASCGCPFSMVTRRTGRWLSGRCFAIPPQGTADRGPRYIAALVRGQSSSAVREPLALNQMELIRKTRYVFLSGRAFRHADKSAYGDSMRPEWVLPAGSHREIGTAVSLWTNVLFADAGKGCYHLFLLYTFLTPFVSENATTFQKNFHRMVSANSHWKVEELL